MPRKSWKEFAGRKGGNARYKFGDVTRGLIRDLGKGKRKTILLHETEELDVTFTEPGAWGMTFDWRQIDMNQQVDNAAAVATVLEASGEAARVGVQKGDVVIEVGGKSVTKLVGKHGGVTGAAFKELLIETKARPCPVRVARPKAPRIGSSGTLSVCVVSAKQLRAADSNGLSDPYAKLRIGEQTNSTSVVDKNLNPTWDESFEFFIPDLSSTDLLTITVFDKDTYSSDDFLGQVTFPPAGQWQTFVSSLVETKVAYSCERASGENYVLPLLGKKGEISTKTRGKIELRFSFKPTPLAAGRHRRQQYRNVHVEYLGENSSSHGVDVQGKGHYLQGISKFTLDEPTAELLLQHARQELSPGELVGGFGIGRRAGLAPAVFHVLGRRRAQCVEINLRKLRSMLGFNLASLAVVNADADQGGEEDADGGKGGGEAVALRKAVQKECRMQRLLGDLIVDAVMQVGVSGGEGKSEGEDEEEQFPLQMLEILNELVPSAEEGDELLGLEVDGVCTSDNSGGSTSLPMRLPEAEGVLRHVASRSRSLKRRIQALLFRARFADEIGALQADVLLCCCSALYVRSCARVIDCTSSSAGWWRASTRSTISQSTHRFAGCRFYP
jgi:hypothetical protein